MHQRGQDLIRSVTNARDRAARKIGLQEQELAATRDRERLRQFGTSSPPISMPWRRGCPG